MFETYTPMTLRNAIEIEMQKTSDAKTAAEIAMKRLAEDPEYYEDMFKAKDISKLTKKIITDKNGHQRVVYVKGAEIAEEKSWINKIAGIFGFKNKSEVMTKIQKIYKEKELDKKYNLTWDSWKNHLAEYFKNKAKWDRFFSGKKEKKDTKDGKPANKKASKPTAKKVKKDNLRLGVMKEIYNIFGGKKEQSDNFGSMLEGKKEKEGNIISFEDFKKITFIEQDKDKKNWRKIIWPGGSMYTDKIGQDAKKDIWETLSIDSPELLKQLQQNLKEDKKVSKAINEATPENRNKKEREILDIPEPEKEIIVEPVLETFQPKDNTIIIPFYKGGSPQDFSVKDYTNISPKDIYLINQKDILTTERPSYIPEMDDDYFRYVSNFIPTYKISEDKYILKTGTEQIVGIEKDKRGENKYVIVNRDILAATQDYYIKRAKELQKNKEAELEKQYNRKFKKKRVSMISERKMSYPQMAILESFMGPISRSSFTNREERQRLWDNYGQTRNDLKQKTEDMQIQIEEYYNTHAKGRETAYGDKGLKDNLLKDYGVRVKRQNGNEINDAEIGDIKYALNKVFEVFGNKSSMAKNFGLKISHAGEVRMHARKAVGLFFPSMKAIGVSAKYGSMGTGFILAHEWGHFMDYYLGEKENRHYASDNPENIEGQIAKLFRKNMSKSQSSVYMNRTCECFARALEQYWAIKTNNHDIVSEWNAGSHPTEEIFKEKIMPLVEQFFKEKNEMLKSFFKLNNKIYKRL